LIVCLALAASMPALAEPAQTPVEDEAVEPAADPLQPPRTRFVYRTLNVFRYNPLGLISSNAIGLRYRLFEPDDLLFSDTYAGLSFLPTVSAGFTRLGVLAEVQPLAVMRLWAALEGTYWYGLFGHLQSFQNPRANFSDSAISALSDLPEGDSRRPSGTLGTEVTLGLDLKIKVGPVAARNLSRLVRGDFDLRPGDNVYYDAFYDVLAPDGGWFLSNDTDVLYVSDFGLVAGLRTNVSMPFYEQKHFAQLDGRRGHANGPTLRTGPLVAYTFFDEPGGWFNKPSVLAIVNWYVAHRYRTGADSHAAIPYFLLGFIMVGDLKPWS
jgi:hypothetical protein